MFRLVKILNGRTNQAEPVKVPSTPAEVYSFGEALALTEGRVTKCAPTERPDCICCEDYTAPAEGGRAILVEAVSSEMIFEAPVSAVPASLSVGAVVTLGEDALCVSATTDGGVATVFDLSDAKNANDKILVRFQ
jgi:hypothetical protein